MALGTSIENSGIDDAWIEAESSDTGICANVNIPDVENILVC